MIHVYDRSRRLKAICGNAFDISEELKINNVNQLSFSLPMDSPDNQYCQPYNLVRYETRSNTSDFYRIIPRVTQLQDFSTVTYQCEHVFALLHDDVLDPMREHIVGGIGFNTVAVINYVLGFQTVRNWNLQSADFAQFFEYGWEKENVLSALGSIPKPITEPWMWTFDTSVYPYRLSLKRINKNKPTPDFWIQGGKNLVRVQDTESNLHIATRLYPFGYGEGTNQLTIEGVNGGVPFIQSPPDVIARYGLISRVMVDRRYKLPGELLSYARQMLAQLQEPHNEYEVDFAMVDSRKRPKLGDVVEIRDENNQPIERNIITGVKFQYGEVEKCSINIANRPRDIAGALADMLDRQRIETSYAQGATQFFTDHVHENASNLTPAVMRVFIPDSMIWINNVVINVRTRGFRAPFDVTEGGGATTQTSGASSAVSSGASTRATTMDGGGQTSGASSANTTGSGGQTTSGPSNNTTTGSGGQTTSGPSNNITSSTHSMGLEHIHPSTVNAGVHNHGFAQGTWIAVTNGSTTVTGSRQWVPSGAHHHGSHSHTMPHTHSLQTHTHGMAHTHSLQTHTHGMAHTHGISAHSHSMEHTHNIAHTHNTTMPNHVHTLVPNIRHIGSPTSFTLRVNGVNVQTVNGTSLQRDITLQLADPALRAIRRNHFHTIEIIPNAHAYVELTLSMQFFIQSKGAHKL